MPKPKKTTPTPKLTRPRLVDADTFVTGRAGRGGGAKSAELKKLSLYFPPDFHREAKGWGVAHDMSLSAMAVEGMKLLMAKRG